MNISSTIRSADGPPLLRREARECWLYDEGQKKANVMKADARGLSSVSLAADSSLCGGSLLARLPAKPPLKGEVSAIGGRRGFVSPAPQGRGGSVSRRDHNQLAETRAHSQAEPTPKKPPSQTPAALRERGVWGERRFSQRSGLSPQTFPATSLPRSSAFVAPP